MTNRKAKPPILNTVHTYGVDDKRPAPSCMGCLPTDGTSAIVVPVPAAYRIISTAYGVDLCTACAVNMIKSLAARFAMYERSATRDLMDFFAVNIRLPKKPRARRKLPKLIASVAGAVPIDHEANAAAERAIGGSTRTKRKTSKVIDV